MTPLERVAHVASKLADLEHPMVYVGASVLGLYISDPAAPPVRATTDVDIVVEVRTYSEYQINLRTELIRRGAREDDSEGAPLGRFILDGITVDIMAPTAHVLNVTNRWYELALATAIPRSITGDLTIMIAPAPCYLATKIEAFAGRGRTDPMSSTDLEDIIQLVDGRPELPSEVLAAASDLRAYISGSVREWLAGEDFRQLVAAQMPGDAASQERVDVILERLAEMLSDA